MPETSAAKLDRIPHFDPRSKLFPVRALMPRTVERVKRLWPVLDVSFPLDQGAEGACVGFGWSGELSADPVRFDTSHTTARELYEQARAIDRQMGNNWTEGASVLAGAKACVAQGKVGAYRWAFGIDDVIDTLVSTGPVVLGVNWHQSMYRTAAGGLVVVDGPIVGGHCILAVGYWPAHPVHGDVVVWLNSWGTGYGVNGVGYVPVAKLDQLLKAGGEACIATDVAPAPPVAACWATRSGSTFHRGAAAHWWLSRAREFPTRDAAVAAGLRPCSMCRP